MSTLGGLFQSGQATLCEVISQGEHSLNFFFGDRVKMNAGSHTHYAVEFIRQRRAMRAASLSLRCPGRASRPSIFFPSATSVEGCGLARATASDMGLAAAAYDLQVLPLTHCAKGDGKSAVFCGQAHVFPLYGINSCLWRGQHSAGGAAPRKQRKEPVVRVLGFQTHFFRSKHVCVCNVRWSLLSGLNSSVALFFCKQ